MDPAPGEVVGGRRGRLRWVRTPALAAGLLLIERQLLVILGTPMAQVRALRDLGRSPTDPVTPLLAALTLLSEALIGYVVIVLALRTLSVLPGSIGRLSGRAAHLVSPGAVRSLLDLLVGGTLLAQATLTAVPSAPQGRTPDPIHTMTTTAVRSIGPVGSIEPTGPAPRMGPAETRPPSRRLAAPLPPWLGGGPSNPRVGYTVAPGDTLWDIAATRLQPARRSSARIDRSWRLLYRANRPAIGPDPDLIHPGTRLDVSWFRGERR